MHTRYFLVRDGTLNHVATWHGMSAAHVPELTVIDTFDDPDEAARLVDRLNQANTSGAMNLPYLRNRGKPPVGGNAYQMEP